MTRIIKSIITGILFSALFGAAARGQTVTAASCSSSDVQTAINSATAGGTVIIPACSSGVSWTSGVTVSGITLQGAGGGRVIAIDEETTAISLTTGSHTFSYVTNDMGATAYLNATPPPITAGETLTIYENGWLANYMHGTVTSFSGSTLVMDVTSAGGTCGTTHANAMNSNCKRWLITTQPSTVLINNLTSGAMISATESTTNYTTITGINFAQGSSGGGAGYSIYRNRNNSAGSCNGSACSILIHDNFFWSNQAEIIDGNTNRGVVWNNSFVFSPFSTGQYAAFRTKDANNTALSTSWSSPDTMGTADTYGTANSYLETNDIHALTECTDLDDNSRTVVRYNLLDEAGCGSHGADTSYVGVRYFEFYNNAGVFEAYSGNDPSVANLTWWYFVRGGTFVFHDNTLPAITSEYWGAKPDINLTTMSLQRVDNYPCWGAGFTTPGQYYPTVRQVGFGYVTGTRTANYPADGYKNVSTTSNSKGYTGPVYVGDSDPIYIWNNNSRTMNVTISDYGLDNGSTSCPSSPTPDSSVNYIVSGRDYFNGTARPGYTPYTYPHPLTGGQSSGNLTPPTNVKAVGH